MLRKNSQHYSTSGIALLCKEITQFIMATHKKNDSLYITTVLERIVAEPLPILKTKGYILLKCFQYRSHLLHTP